MHDELLQKIKGQLTLFWIKQKKAEDAKLIELH